MTMKESILDMLERAKNDSPLLKDMKVEERDSAEFHGLPKDFMAGACSVKITANGDNDSYSDTISYTEIIFDKDGRILDWRSWRSWRRT